ncbi:MAG: hypothetical protein PHH83_04810, partial [Patescibacteria group bacterium]|nr:hypothetical protein [Patescibacteria group bacterium]
MFKTKSIEKQLKVKEGKLKNSPIASEEQKEILESEKVYRRGTVSIKELISPSAYKVESSFLRLNNKFLSTLYIVTYPRFINIGWFAPIINYSIPLDVSIYYYPVDSPKILKKLKTKVGNIEAQLSLDAEKGTPRDPQLETALSDIEQLRDNLTQGVEKFFQMGFYVTIYADNPEDLDKRLENVENIFGSKLIFTKRS